MSKKIHMALEISLKLIKMQTVLWLTNFLGSIFCSGISLYFYLAHDDLEHGLMEPFDISEQISKYWPMEFFV